MSRSNIIQDPPEHPTNAPKGKPAPNPGNLASLIKAKISLPLIEMADGAKARQQELILASRKVAIGPIADKENGNEVGIAARDIRTHVKQVRDMAKALRDPLTAASKRIIQIEDDYCGPLETEQKRLERLVTDWAEQERKRVEREEKERAEKISAEPDPEIRRELIVAPLPEANKITGATTKRVVRWKVTDEVALYRVRPELFSRPEIKKSAVNAVCFPNRQDATETDPDLSVPGLSLWYAFESSVRSW